MDGGDLGTIARANNVSYLYARDPSILAWGVAGNSRKNLISELGEVTSSSAEPESDTVSTYLRIKTCGRDDGLYKILDQRTLQSNVPEGSHAARFVKEGDHVTKKYTFTKIFSGNASQSELFYEIKPKMLKFLNGHNYSLLSYGASGSGKTYTIVGTAEEPGIIPRALEYVFRSLPSLSDEPNIKLKSDGIIVRRGEASFPRNDKSIRDHLLKSVSSFSDFNQHIRTYREMQKRLSVEAVAVVEVSKDASLGVFVSFAEIYNEHIYDLLTPQNSKQREKLSLGNCNGMTYIKNLTMVPVSSGYQAFQILQYGLRNLNYASTRVNNHSSRSHCIFTIRLVQASMCQEGYSVSYFHFCDLAGSERVKKTLNVGDRLKESNNINTSLLVLGRCIKAVRESQKHKDSRLIPFRESKLTLFFKRALSGLEDISMIVNITPVRDMFDESQHVLNFSAIAKDIIIEQQPVPQKQNRFSNYMQSRSTSYAPISEENEKLYAEIERLTDRVAQLEYENSCLDEELIQVEQQARNDVVRTYQEILQKKEDAHKKQIITLKERHKEKLARLKESYAKQPSTVEIINLDSSDDSTGQEQQNIIEKLKAQVEDLTKTLNDAHDDYTQLQKELNNLKREHLQVCEELDMYKSSMKTLQHSDDYNSQDELEGHEENPQISEDLDMYKNYTNTMLNDNGKNEFRESEKYSQVYEEINSRIEENPHICEDLDVCKNNINTMQHGEDCNSQKDELRGSEKYSQAYKKLNFCRKTMVVCDNLQKDDFRMSEKYSNDGIENVKEERV